MIIQFRIVETARPLKTFNDNEYILLKNGSNSLLVFPKLYFEGANHTLLGISNFEFYFLQRGVIHPS